MANLIYTQFVLPLLDYADFLFESATKKATDQLDKLQKTAIRIIDRGTHGNHTDDALEILYSPQPSADRRREHHHRLKDIPLYIDVERPEVILRNRHKIKVKTPATKLTKVLTSLFYRGSRLWDTLHENVQRATTKVKLKNMIVN